MNQGYGQENLATILSAAPPQEDLEGYRLVYRHVYPGEEYWTAGKFDQWPCGHPVTSLNPQLVRVPVVEYLEGDAITDEHAKLRPPCRVGTHEYPGILVYVDRAHTFPFVVNVSDEIGRWRDCRIRKDAVEELDR